MCNGSLRFMFDNLLRKIGVSDSDDCEIVAQVAWLVDNRFISEVVALESALGPKMSRCDVKNPIGYFRSCLRQRLGRGEFERLLDRVPFSVLEGVLE